MRGSRVTRSHASLPPSGGNPDESPHLGLTAPAPRGPSTRGRSTLNAQSLAAGAQQAKREGLTEATEPADKAAAVGVDEDTVLGAVGVRPLRKLRPVPRQARPVPTPSSSSMPPRPVYDPFSARRRRAPEWLISYTATLVVGDLLAVGLGVTLALFLPLSGGTPGNRIVELVVAAWAVLLAALGADAPPRLGSRSDEYRRVLVGGLTAIALLSFAVQVWPTVGLERLLLVGAPITTVLTLVGRNLNRRRIQAARRRGLMTKRVVLVGRPRALADLARRLCRDAASGLRVVGACVPAPDDALVLADEGVPVLGGLQEVLRSLDDVGADAVVVASASETASQYLRDLAWRLEGTNIELLVVPGLVEVASNRLQVRPTTSLPLLQVQEPEFRGSRRMLKSLMDRTVAGLLLLVAAPGMIAIAVAIRLGSSGPVLYRHRRIGKRGREFDVLKFRSMVTDAEDKLAELMAFNEGNDVQFKMRQDPRVTRVGAFLRRYSLDELPQLINVLKGDMSLVGPRPHVTREVELYGPEMHRRLLVKPGITGLWQVSGRSDLSWEESVELDIRYVENWSLGLDLTILWRTFRAVLGSDGAY
jgi:exopolysaccharide biosynthesis polyprenyl glycosylphosphotransferase